MLRLFLVVNLSKLHCVFISFSSAGKKELSPPPLNLRRLYAETLEWEPVLIIISPGADPSQELSELAAETVGRDNYHEVVGEPGTADQPITSETCFILPRPQLLITVISFCSVDG